MIRRRTLIRLTKRALDHFGLRTWVHAQLPPSLHQSQRLTGYTAALHARVAEAASLSLPAPVAPSGHAPVTLSLSQFPLACPMLRQLAAEQPERWVIVYDAVSYRPTDLPIPATIAAPVEVVLFTLGGSLNRPFRHRRPERALTFAVRAGVLGGELHHCEQASPIALLVALLSDRQRPLAHIAVAAPRPRNRLHRLAHTLLQPLHRGQDRVPTNRLALKVFAEALARARPTLAAPLLTELPYAPGSLPVSSETPQQYRRDWTALLPGERTTWDLLFITDFRIRGGTIASVLSEIELARAEGWRVAALQLDAATYTAKSWSLKQDALGCLADLGVPLLNAHPSARARLAVLRYPPAFVTLPAPRPRLTVERAVLVVNQPPQRLTTDQPFYDPLACHTGATQLLGSAPVWAPNGPDARAAMAAWNATLPLTAEDWLNVVPSRLLASDAELAARAARAATPQRPLVIGRHVRDVYNKWPSDPATLLAAYPETPEIEARFLGGCSRPRRILGRMPENWLDIKYGALPVTQFLAELDVFVFFPHEARIEPMARCVVEAMAAGLPVILPERFRGCYGETPIYCSATAVLPTLRALAADQTALLERCRRTRDEARERFGVRAYRNRLAAYGVTNQRSPAAKEHADG
ncbi:hypothetical protein CKO15_02400 [Halorhodospira abdelmalekii]|uniref:glycosyltransferase n=1 Tax=Halorhodospira abdelmalekii TaxID=421629 RepID=UPI001907AF86|nr:hypothetical protein [Halorhodospira abdelmalekii]MBK1734150.1 hypothetical protein [Halorhodospira abdelmalekii]